MTELTKTAPDYIAMSIQLTRCKGIFQAKFRDQIIDEVKRIYNVEMNSSQIDRACYAFCAGVSLNSNVPQNMAVSSFDWMRDSFNRWDELTVNIMIVGFDAGHLYAHHG